MDTIGEIEAALEQLPNSKCLALKLDKKQGWPGVDFKDSWRIEVGWDFKENCFVVSQHKVLAIDEEVPKLKFPSASIVVEYLFGANYITPL